MTTLGVFRVGTFATLKTVKQLSLSNLQVTPNYLLFNIGKLFSGLDTSAIPDNRCLTECDFIRENQPSSGQVVDFEQLIRKTPPVYGQT